MSKSRYFYFHLTCGKKNIIFQNFKFFKAYFNFYIVSQFQPIKQCSYYNFSGIPRKILIKLYIKHNFENVQSSQLYNCAVNVPLLDKPNFV